MKIVIYLLALTGILYSCSSEDTCNGNLVEREQKQLFEAYGQGEELLYVFKEQAEDKSAPQIQKYFKLNLSRANDLDEKAFETIRELEKLEHIVANELFEGSADRHITNQNGNERALINAYEFGTCVNNPSTTEFSSTSVNGKKIQTLISKFRKDYTEKLALTSNIRNAEIHYSFTDLGIPDFKNKKDLHDKVAVMVAKSTVAPDDEEAIIRIYSDLSFSKKDWQQLLPEETSCLEVIRLINYLEQNILQIRINALRLMRSRFSGDEYGFNKIMSLATGKDIISAGDTLEIAVTVAAFNSMKDPIVKCTNGKVVGISSRNGIAKIRVIVPEKSEQKVTYKGSVTMMNKSGVPKTIPWEKDVWVSE